MDWSVWYFEPVCAITEGHMTRNQQIVFDYLKYNITKYRWVNAQATIYRQRVKVGMGSIIPILK